MFVKRFFWFVRGTVTEYKGVDPKLKLKTL